MLFRFGSLTLDTERLELADSGRPLSVEPQVFRMLRYLIEHQDRVVSKDELIGELWDGRVVSDATLTSRINLLRSTIGDSGRRQAIIKTYPKRGYRFVADLTSEDAPAAAPESAAPHRPDSAPMEVSTPTVAVLPFKDLGGGDEGDLFAEGITEEVTVALSRSSELAVVALRSAMALQQDSPLLSEAGRRLNARYLVNGSVRRSGERVRVTAQLLDTGPGRNLWAERFDGQTTDIFDIQDRVAQSIAAALPGRIRDNEARGRLARRTPPSSAYEAWLSALWGLRRTGDVLQAMENFRQVLARDDEFALAHSALAVLQGFSVFVTGRDDPAQVDESLAHAHRALALDPRDERVHAQAGMAFLDAGEFALALRHTEVALELNPHSIESIHFRGCVLGSTGDPTAALALQRQVMTLDPLFPTHYFENVIEAHYLLGQYEEAIAIIENWDRPHQHVKATMGACYALQGDPARGRALVQEFLDSRPEGFQVGDYLRAVLRYHARPEDRQRWMEGFERSGLTAQG